MAAATGSGFGRVLPIFGARTAASAPTLPLPLRSRKRRERAHAGERAHQRAAADAVRAARRQKGADVGRRQRGERLQRRRAAEMLGQEAQELPHVAPIGFERLWRHAPLGAEMAEPALDLGRDLGRDEVRLGSCDLGRALDTAALYRAAFRSRFLNRRIRPCPCLSRRIGQPWPDASSMSCVPVALDQAYSYRVPDGLSSRPATSSRVPLGAREATAVVWAENPKPNPRLDNRLKDIEDKLDLPPLKPELRSFVDWVANYTLSRAAWCCACACAWASISAPSASASACGSPARRRSA